MELERAERQLWLLWTMTQKKHMHHNREHQEQGNEMIDSSNSSSSFDMTAYKADSLLQILEGSGHTKEHVMKIIGQCHGDAEAALELLLL